MSEFVIIFLWSLPVRATIRLSVYMCGGGLHSLSVLHHAMVHTGYVLRVFDKKNIE